MTLSEAIDELRQGGVVALPTDTVYGLVADSRCEAAVRRLYDLKGRPAHKSLPLLVTRAVAVELMPPLSGDGSRLLDRFWPGPLTVVVRAGSRVPGWITAENGTVALREPNHPLVLTLVRELGAPLASTSANRSGEPECLTVSEVAERLPELRGRVLEAEDDPAPAGRASSVVDLSRQPPVLLREGALPLEALRQVLPSLVPSQAVPPESPG